MDGRFVKLKTANQSEDSTVEPPYTYRGHHWVKKMCPLIREASLRGVHW